MAITQEQVTSNIDELVKASEDFEQRMLEAGISQAHNWMFGIRVMLYDLRRLNILLAHFLNITDVGSQAPGRLLEIVQTMRYDIAPHIDSHMDELNQELSTLFPDKLDWEE